MAKYFELFKNPVFAVRSQIKHFCSKTVEETKSSLFISGKRAQDTFVAVIPHLEFDERFKNLDSLKENIKRRKLDLNADELMQSWEFYKDWNDKRKKLQDNLDETGRKMKELLKKEDSEAKAEIKNIERLREILRKDLHEVKESVWAIEDNVIGNLLRLPNKLHPLSPEEEEEIYSFENESIHSKGDHLNVGNKLNVVQYLNPYTYFLKEKAAVFELALVECCIDNFINKGFVQFSNPDFTRSVLSEGVGVEPSDHSESFLLEEKEANNDLLHLCGGASLFPFCGFHAKHVVQRDCLPVKYITAGRRYTPATSSLPGLFSVHQTTSVQVFIGTKSDEEIYHEFECCLKVFEDLFDKFGLKYRIVKQPPYFYKNWDCLRVSLQVFSPFNESFVEVGHLSLIDDFISKRLRMYCDDKKGDCFLKVASGTVLNVPTFLALCLERSQGKLFIPNNLKEFWLT